jgi:hypothetical protein
MDRPGRKPLLVLALLLVSMQSAASTAASCDSIVVDRHVASLREAYARFGNPAESPDAVRAFFDALPESFACYNAVFGYPSGPLYQTPQMHAVFP